MDNKGFKAVRVRQDSYDEIKSIATQMNIPLADVVRIAIAKLNALPASDALTVNSKLERIESHLHHLDMDLLCINDYVSRINDSLPRALQAPIPMMTESHRYLEGDKELKEFYRKNKDEEIARNKMIKAGEFHDDKTAPLVSNLMDRIGRPGARKFPKTDSQNKQ
jgi:hypothetical protein